MSSLSSCLSLTKNLVHASLSNNNNNNNGSLPPPPPLQANPTKPPLSSRNQTPTVLPRKKQKNQPQRKPRQPSVIEIERAIGGGRFRDADPRDLEEQKNAKFDMSMMNFPSKFEGPVEKKLRETGEWITNKTERGFRLSGNHFLFSLFFLKRDIYHQ
ncbi:PREDICTED: probable NAD(P)H dehydrogenase subunit CRR3 [Prunus dulcis]|uniref:PREDICTED: probable NAD(P)H dehydrogenase subunit CRR3 n=1 Tax=Prunus dulcis TaxID=3755 RepID=A0A5E4EL03_PRUDU|nr:PREDICTED: probable NAD(P)H dehydrogenase subunit CRR3 [Prunus dulcis]